MNSPNALSSGPGIAAFCERHSLTAADLARLLGVPRQNVSDWLAHGIRRKSLHVLVERALRDVERELREQRSE